MIQSDESTAAFHLHAATGVPQRHAEGSGVLSGLRC